jgi:hypothetical protein
MSGENVGPVGPPLNCKRLEIGRSKVRVNVSRPPSDRGIIRDASKSRAFLWCHASLVGSPSNAMVDRVGGIVAVPARRTNWTTVPLYSPGYGWPCAMRKH